MEPDPARRQTLREVADRRPVTEPDLPGEGRGAPIRFYVGIGLAAMLMPLNSTMIAVALPRIGVEFATGVASLTGWLVTSYIIATLVFQSPGGKLGDLWGHSRVLAWGSWIFAAATFLVILVPTLAGLAVARIVMGIAAALMLPTAMALLRIYVPEPRRPTAFGMFSSLMAAAAALGPIMGGPLIEHFGWQSVFIVNLPVIAASFLLQLGHGGRREERGPRSAGAAGFDWIGTALLGVGLVALVAAASASAPWSVALIGGGLVAFLAFGAWERRVAEPIVDLTLFLRRPFTAGSVVVGLQHGAMYAILFSTPFLFEQIRAMSPSEVGFALMVLMSFMVLLGPIGGRLAERIGPRVTVLAGSACAATGAALTGVVFTAASAWPVLVGLALIGGGMGLSYGPAQAPALSSAPRDKSGMASAALSTVRYLGGIAGIATMGAFFVEGASAAEAARHLWGFWLYAAAYGLSGIIAIGLPGKTPASPCAANS